MILLTLSRGKGEETVRLQLPASPAEIGETFAFLDRISLDTTATAILDVSSNVPVLYRCLYDVDVEDSEQFQKLQKLAERTEALSPAKAAIFSGALDAECVWNLEGALTVADRLDEYMLVNNVSSDSELGIYLVNKGITPFPDRFKPYINYARVGAEYREKHGGEYSSGNYVQKKTPELLENERLDGVFRIWMENPCPVRVQSETAQITLPATFEQLESARQLLGVDSLNMAKLTRVEALRPYYTLDGIKSKTVGDGQHGTARWATKQEIRQTYAHVPFEPELWRKGEHLPEKQGLVLGCEGPKDHVTALVDTDDIHAMVTAASGAGKTAFFLYPNIEYALASGMSFLCTDTKGDLFRNYAGIAKDCYGYQIAVLDLRNPTRSDGNNLLHLINKYMDIYKADPKNLAAKAKAEKYSKILAKTLINTSGGDSAQYGQNAFFYDSAEGLLTAMFLLVAEYLPTEDADGNPIEKRHIVSVFKLVQELLAPSRVKGKNQFQLLLEKLPPNHKARWFAGSALNTAEQAMASVISTVLSRLNAFLDSEMEQILCFDTAIDAEKFAAEKSAIFLILPEEDQTKNFMAGLMIQNLSRELFAVADENGGKLKNRVILFCDELGTMPPFDILPLFSAGRSRRLTLVPIIQSLAQLEKNYGKEGASILMDNCQDVICGGFAPNSEAADTFSKALGSRTVLSGSVSRGKNDPSQSLQMMERPLLTADELKSIPKGSFIVQKTGCHPMRTRLRLFLEWGITFEEEYRVEEQAARRVYYADQNALTRAIVRKYPPKLTEQKTTRSVKGEGQLHDTPVQEMVVAEDIDYDRMLHKRTPYNLPRQEVDR